MFCLLNSLARIRKFRCLHPHLLHFFAYFGMVEHKQQVRYVFGSLNYIYTKYKWSKYYLDSYWSLSAFRKRKQGIHMRHSKAVAILFFSEKCHNVNTCVCVHAHVGGWVGVHAHMCVCVCIWVCLLYLVVILKMQARVSF